jgi:putative membrane protein
MMWWNHGGWGAGDWLAMSFTMLVFWGLLTVLVIWLVRSSRSEQDSEHASTRTAEQRADDRLAERFARGEIDEAEFVHRRELLQTTTGLV